MTKALSQRETQVLALARAGHSTKEIASELGISTSTVNWHRKLALARQTASPSVRDGEAQAFPRGKFRA
jgi:DNA-binding NarL/FixJ family response regulator